ncbi:MULTISPECIES: 1-aminocyclopropane-1-carboxylate deaminase/D-cysteine desulfhydrase [unclassified Kitasatospora]|uniref:1-aminocyclopropane-1-carboxylate deaminase/D-cysteine desulfhydrase n=1 Tax=unclassified Kitasatospora TaxID=2633591 RepID=UPI00070BC884|nr:MULTISPECIES: pyridoxal-phosphate dependent enzyme [unclassified Kitasatospora]KQV05574.1 1-aminocyclopropane-1-carboxylate deaminase [Kitasatospora sp. Root107]KRB62376.1 1-aminocyclopropane-1-carboxylate deaminase [Kitasatospora sp. Root187]
MLLPADLPTPLQVLDDPDFARAGVELQLKRDDLAHPTVPGNKWRKLAPNLAYAVETSARGLLTFGGAYSTHLRAVAAAAQALGLPSIGVVRGDELAAAPRNWSLRAAEGYGMELRFVSRADYRALLTDHQPPAPGWLVLPEGGSNPLAVEGAAAIPAEIPDLGPADLLACPVGTGGTLAGIAAGLPHGARALGVAVLRGEGYLEREVADLHQATCARQFTNWSIVHTHHGGGYGRLTPELTAFAEEFEQRHGLALERRYVAKTLQAVHHAAVTHQLTPGTRVTVVITGLPDPT